MSPRLSGLLVLCLLSIAAAFGQQAVASFPDPTINVGVEAILAPRGTVDSGQSIIPRCIVANYGDTTASPSVVFNVFSGGTQVYWDSLVLPGLQPAQRETVAYTPWAPEGRDSMEAVAWTVCAGDTYPQNDTARVRFLVRVFDVYLTLMLPDTLNDSTPILPRARVWNYGNQTVVGYLEFRVDTTYYSRRDISLIPGGQTIVTAPDSWYPKSCLMACSLFLNQPDTCLAWDIETVFVRGTLVIDVAVLDLWQDSTGLHSIVANLGTSMAMCMDFLEVRDSMQVPVYRDSMQHVLPVGESIAEDWPAIRLQPGLYVAMESVYTAGDMDPTNNVMYLQFRVNPPAVAEGQSQAPSSKLQATVIRNLSRGAVAFDASGRRVTTAKAGVYFLAVGGERSAVSVRKVVIQR